MKYLLVLCTCMVSLSGFSQSKKISFKLGSEYELPKRAADLAFFGNAQDGIVNLALKKDNLSITRFDPSTLNQTNGKEIQLAEATKYFVSEKVIDFGNKYFWIHSDWDKDAGKEFLYYDQIDVLSGKIASSNNKMLETTKMTREAAPSLAGGMFSFLGTGSKYNLNTDVANKKLLVSYRLVPEEKKDKNNFDKIGICVFDDNLNKLWGNEFTMPYTEARMDNCDYSIDSKGNAYLLAKVYDTDARKEKDSETDKPAYHYEILKFTKDNKDIIHTKIDVGDFFIREATLIENVNHDMVVACTYSKKAKGRSAGTDGIFLAMVNPQGEVVKYKNGYYEFPLAELEKFESARNKRRMERKDDYEAPNLKVKNIITESDGSILLTCEEDYIIIHRNMNSGMGGMGMSGMTTTTYYTYHYEDIVAVKINAMGEYEWLRKIPKKQSGVRGEGSMSFKLINDSTGYYFLYLDNIKNMELTENEVPKEYRDGTKGQVVVSKIDNKGTLTKELILDTKEEEIKIFPTAFRRINGNQFIGRATLQKNLYKPLLITVN